MFRQTEAYFFADGVENEPGPEFPVGNPHCGGPVFGANGSFAEFGGHGIGDGGGELWF